MNLKMVIGLGGYRELPPPDLQQVILSHQPTNFLSSNHESLSLDQHDDSPVWFFVIDVLHSMKSVEFLAVSF